MPNTWNIDPRHAPFSKKLVGTCILFLLVFQNLVLVPSETVLAAPPVGLSAGIITSLDTAYTENFDSLATSGTNLAWTDNATLPGWYSSRTTYNTGTGSSNTGALYSFGSTAAPTDRAIGSVGSSGTGTVYWGVKLANNSGSTITSIDISYVGEQWRNAGSATATPSVAQIVDFQYQTANPGTITGINTPASGWVDYDPLDFSSPVFGTTTSNALDGNQDTNRVSKASTLTITVNNGQEVWLRWKDVDHANNDHGLAIDDFSATAHTSGATPTPTPTATPTPIPTPTPTPTPTATPTPTPFLSGSVAISQVYGGGGNTGSTLKNDYIELINRGAASVDLSGWSVQVFSTQNSIWDLTPLTGVTLQPGQYYLVQESQGAGGTDNLPSPDASGVIPVSSTSSKVALVSNSTTLTGTCPTGSGIVDFVGYGAQACFEGSGPAPTLTNTTAALRLNDGCFDTDDNANDFVSGAPAPRNSASAFHDCTGISGFGSSNPGSVLQGQSSTLTVHVAPAQNPPSTGITVTGDLTSIGGSATQLFAGSGSSFSFNALVPPDNAPGLKSLPITISDGQGRSSHTNIQLSVLPVVPDHVVISQIYGGGGNTGATYHNDYVELYNPTSSPVDVGGWTIQYASSTGTSFQVQPLGGILQPGDYYLISLASGGAPGAALPPSNVSGSINMSGTTGKVALSSGGDAFLVGCPIGDSTLVDFVGYGTGADCREGGGTTASNAPVPSNTTSILRKNGGLTDTNVNSFDFITGPPNPRRTAVISEIGPYVLNVDPRSNSTDAPHDDTITVNFTEAVDVDSSWYNISCAASGLHNDATIAHTDDFKAYAITPNTNFQFGEVCTGTIFQNAVHDQDTDDSAPGTDTLKADYLWSFTVVAAGSPAPFPQDIHLAMGNPSGADGFDPDNYLMQRSGNALSYNRSKGTPNWVSWHLDSAWYGTLARVDTFRADPQVPADWYRVEGFDYTGTGFDRGHMTPNADRDNQFRTPINQETYLMSNMVPQAPDNNQGPWANMEGDLRTIADTGKELFIVSGPLGVGGSGTNGGTTNTIANGHVTVPAFTWKVVLQLPHGVTDPSQVGADATTFAVMMPNTNGIRNVDWHTYKITVRQVEQATGLNFFSNVAPAVQNSIENGLDGANPPGTADGSVSVNEDTPTSFTLNAVDPANGQMTAAINQPAHGTVSCVNINCTYTPGSNFNGTDSFTFNVTNGQKTSNTSTVNVIVSAVNDAPTANGQSPTTFEDMPAAISLTGSDIETPSADLGFNITQAPLHGTLSGTAPDLTYSPLPNYNGPDTFKFTVTDTGDGSSPALTSSEATVNITVISVNDLPGATNDQAAGYPSVQYSDPIRAINFSATDIETPAGQLIPTEAFSKDGGSAQSGLPSGLTLAQTATTGNWTLAGNISAPAGSYSISVTFADGDGGTATTSASITVTKEDASLVISGSTAVGVDPATGRSTAFTLNADISQAPDGGLGNISNAVPVTFQLTPVGSGLPAYSCTATAVSPGTSTASCTFSDVNVDVYDISAVIGGGFYQGSNRSVIAVYDPSLGFVTGSGSLVRTVNGETFTSDFTVNLKYQKNGGTQGSFLYVEHHASGDVSFSGNSMGALAITSAGAKMTGTGSLNGISGYSFIGTFVDAGEPGTNDQVGFRLTDSGGSVIADLSFDPLKLSAGNIRVH